MKEKCYASVNENKGNIMSYENPEYNAIAKPVRPTPVMVLGILSIVFGALGVLCTPVGLLMNTFMGGMLEGMPGMENNPGMAMMNDPGAKMFTLVSGIIGFVGAGVLLASGIGLLKMKPWARTASIGYAVYRYIFIVVGGVLGYYMMTLPMMEAARNTDPDMAAVMEASGVFGAIFGSCFSLIYPTVLLVFMLLPNIKAAFATEPPSLENRA